MSSSPSINPSINTVLQWNGYVSTNVRRQFFAENGTSIRNGVLLSEKDFTTFRSIDKDMFKQYATALFWQKYGRGIDIDAVKCTHCLYLALTKEEDDDKDDEYYSDAEVRDRAR